MRYGNDIQAWECKKVKKRYIINSNRKEIEMNWKKKWVLLSSSDEALEESQQIQWLVKTKAWDLLKSDLQLEVWQWSICQQFWPLELPVLPLSDFWWLVFCTVHHWLFHILLGSFQGKFAFHCASTQQVPHHKATCIWMMLSLQPFQRHPLVHWSDLEIFWVTNVIKLFTSNRMFLPNKSLLKQFLLFVGLSLLIN